MLNINIKMKVVILFFALVVSIIASDTEVGHKCIPRLCHFVCGTNGVTYNSPCFLTEAAYQTNQNLKIIYMGHCGYPLRNIYCNCPPIDDPHCASDGRTYRNLCEFNCFRENFSDLAFVKLGTCDKPLPEAPIDLCA